MCIRFALLGLLAEQPRHGYELRAAFTALVGGEENWPVKPAQIYTTLNRLEESGLVKVEGLARQGGPEKRIYAITAAGREELGRWLNSASLPEYQRDEFFVKLMLSLATSAAAPAKLIHTQRTALYRVLHDITARRRQADPKTELAQILLLDKSVMYLEADLRWLDMVESRLDEIRRQPLPKPVARPRGRPRLKPEAEIG